MLFILGVSLANIVYNEQCVHEHEYECPIGDVLHIFYRTCACVVLICMYVFIEFFLINLVYMLACGVCLICYSYRLL